MIQQALQHCAGIGPVRLAKLHRLGVRSWTDVLTFPDRIPLPCRDELTEESRRCISALDEGNIRYFVERFVPRDKWRILDHFFDQVTFFDIETEGLEYDAPITVIVCWHRARLRTFVEHENLDDFLTLLDDVSLLASFNGSTFDVPRVLGAFHIPSLPCPHLDLRWPCYHRGFTGGLKDIASQVGITRPADLTNVDGELAVRLWHAWVARNDAAARRQLVRYCAADVILLVELALRLIERPLGGDCDLWAHLPAAPDVSSPRNSPPEPAAEGSLGNGNPSRIRPWRRRPAIAG